MKRREWNYNKKKDTLRFRIKTKKKRCFWTEVKKRWNRGGRMRMRGVFLCVSVRVNRECKMLDKKKFVKTNFKTWKLTERKRERKSTNEKKTKEKKVKVCCWSLLDDVLRLTGGHSLGNRRCKETHWEIFVFWREKWRRREKRGGEEGERKGDGWKRWGEYAVCNA